MEIKIDDMMNTVVGIVAANNSFPPTTFFTLPSIKQPIWVLNLCSKLDESFLTYLQFHLKTTFDELYNLLHQEESLIKRTERSVSPPIAFYVPARGCGNSRGNWNNRGNSRGYYRGCLSYRGRNPCRVLFNGTHMDIPLEHLNR